MLKPALARGELQCVGATTLDEYRKHIEKDAALERRFAPVYVEEPSVEDTIEMLHGLRDRYEAHHKVRFSDAALVAAARAFAALRHRPAPARQGHRPDGRGRRQAARGAVLAAARAEGDESRDRPPGRGRRAGRGGARLRARRPEESRAPAHRDRVQRARDRWERGTPAGRGGGRRRHRRGRRAVDRAFRSAR